MPVDGTLSAFTPITCGSISRIASGLSTSRPLRPFASPRCRKEKQMVLAVSKCSARRQCETAKTICFSALSQRVQPDRFLRVAGDDHFATHLIRNSVPLAEPHQL